MQTQSRGNVRGLAQSEKRKKRKTEDKKSITEQNILRTEERGSLNVSTDFKVAYYSFQKRKIPFLKL